MLSLCNFADRLETLSLHPYSSESRSTTCCMVIPVRMICAFISLRTFILIKSSINFVCDTAKTVRPTAYPLHRLVKNLQSLKSVQNFACDVLSIYDHIPLYCSVWFGLEQRKHPLFRERGTLFREARFREMVSFCGQNLSCFHYH